MLAKSPAFTALAVLTLALGIGANLALFALLNNQFLRPRPVFKPEELWAILPADLSGEPKSFNLSRPYYDAVRAQNSVFKSVVGEAGCCTRLRTSDGWEQVVGQMVSGDYFSSLGVQPRLGRGFLPEEDDKPGSHSVAVISSRLWERHFQEDPAVLGKTLILQGENGDCAVEVVGVAPPGFVGMGLVARDFWVPASMGKMLGQIPSYELFGRLKPGVNPLVAAASLAPVVQGITKALHPVEFPFGATPDDANNNSGFTRVAVLRAGYGSIGPERIHRSRAALIKVNSLAAAGTLLVLLIAASNLGNLVLARGLGRRKEMATRLALGAPQWALVRQLTIEGMVLVALATIAALLVLTWIGHAAPALLSAVAYNGQAPVNFQPDIRVIGFAIAGGLLTGVAFSVPPAILATRFDPFVVLKESHPSAGAHERGWSVRKFLVVAQVAGSLVLLSAVCLCLRAISQQLRGDLGFRPERLILASVDLESIGCVMSNALPMCEELRSRLSALPGIETIGILDQPLFCGQHNSVVADHLDGYDGTVVRYRQEIVGPNVFHALGVRILHGREVTPGDLAGGRRVALVNESFVRKFWPDRAVLGKQIQWIREPYEVIGVVADARFTDPQEASMPTVYMADSLRFALGPTFILRTSVPPESLTKAIRAELMRVHLRLRESDVLTMRQAMLIPFTPQRNMLRLLGEIATLALGLTILGAYGLISYLVTQRTREVGIRLALGAQRAEVTQLILRSGVGLSLAGVGLGLPAAFCGSLLLRHVVPGVSPFDLPAFLIAAGAVMFAIVLACWLPARRAAKVDPIVALR